MLHTLELARVGTLPVVNKKVAVASLPCAAIGMLART
jgi:hypothetical protein